MNDDERLDVLHRMHAHAHAHAHAYAHAARAGTPTQNAHAQPRPHVCARARARTRARARAHTRMQPSSHAHPGSSVCHCEMYMCEQTWGVRSALTQVVLHGRTLHRQMALSTSLKQMLRRAAECFYVQPASMIFRIVWRGDQLAKAHNLPKAEPLRYPFDG
jgi:hypothetical protein